MMHSKHIFLINAYAQKIQDLFLHNMDEYHSELVKSIRECAKEIGDIAEDKLFRFIDKEGLGVYIDGQLYEGGMFVLASDRKIDDVNITYIPFFNKLKFHIDLRPILEELIKEQGYTLNESIKVPFSTEYIKLSELIKACNKKSMKKRKEIFALAYEATADIVLPDDEELYQRPTIEKIIRKVC